jgi:peptidoglycan hydrolase-like protein with peptidoglycan-binding domain
MIIKRGDKGPHVKDIQRELYKAGFWPSYVPYSENFGPTTDKYVRLFQTAKGLVSDGKVGKSTIKKLGGKITLDVNTKYDERYKRVTIMGSSLRSSPIRNNIRIRFNKDLVERYLPEMRSAMSDKPKGFQLLVTIMAYKEGYRKGTRSYRFNNPGNIGNNDRGDNKAVGSLKAGVLLQRDYIQRIANGTHSAYPMGKRKLIRPYFSKEIAKHTKLYGISPYVPGYDFTFTGELQQFVKIYSTGARASNGYLSMIISYFRDNGITINEKSKIQDIIKIKE